MRVRLSALLCVMFFLCGCAGEDSALDRAVSLRNKIQSSNGCSFYTEITADYGEKIYVFSMDCIADREGNLTFTVTEPTTIAGITGKISDSGGGITFDDQVLAFQLMADGQITPVSAPWLLMKTLRSGYLKDCTTTDKGFEISIDDSYEEKTLHLRINTEGDLPVSAEIFWQGRRVLTLHVENFIFL